MNWIFWVDIFRESYIPQVQYFSHCYLDRLLNSFSELEEEATRMEEEKHQELLQRPCCGDCCDPGDIAETATNAATAWHFNMKNILQGMKNLFAVGLRHTFEQQFTEYYRNEIHLLRRENEIDTIPKFNVIIAEVDNKLKEAGEVYFKNFNSWTTLEELGLVANVVKHAEGNSAERLRSINPNLFQHPFLKNFTPSTTPAEHITSIFKPLYGEGVYITESDFKRYVEAMMDFWNEMATEFEKIDYR